ILMLLLSVQVTLPRSRLSQVCGFVPPSARNIEVTGFNAFLASRWLTMFQVIPADFEQIRGRLRRESVEPINIKEVVHKAGMLEGTRLFAKLPALKDAQCFKLEEGGPGSAFIIYALYDRGTFTAVV